MSILGVFGICGEVFSYVVRLGSRGESTGLIGCFPFAFNNGPAGAGFCGFVYGIALTLFDIVVCL